MNQDQPVQPANIVNIVAINQGKKPLTMDAPHAPLLTTSEVINLMENRHIIIDTRSEAAFGAGHIPQAYNIQLSSSEFEQRVGWVTPLDAPIVLVLQNDTDLSHALHALAFLGLDHRVSGYLGGGMENWINSGLATRTLPQISVQQLHNLLNGQAKMQILDVRETSEWDAGHIENAHYMNYKFLGDKLDQLSIAQEDNISVVCAAGMRASTACSILAMNGYQHIHNVTGGMNAWAAAGLPMVDNAGEAVVTLPAPKPEWFEQ